MSKNTIRKMPRIIINSKDKNKIEIGLQTQLTQQIEKSDSEYSIEK